MHDEVQNKELHAEKNVTEGPCMYDCVRKRFVNKFELKNLMYNKRYFIFFTLIIRGSKIQELKKILPAQKIRK